MNKQGAFSHVPDPLVPIININKRQEDAAMHEIVSTAKRLRAVRRASDQFLTLWALDCMFKQEGLFNRGAADLTQNEDAVADPGNHDWSLLYRGSILDD